MVHDRRLTFRFTNQVTCNGADFSTDATPLQIAPVPTITSVIPSAGASPRGGRVTVTGVNFPPAPSPECVFGRDSLPGTLTSSSGVLCSSPPARPGAGGVVELTLTFAGVPAAGALAFTLLDPHNSVVIGAIWPSTGPLRGGTVVRFELAEGSKPVPLSAALRCLWGEDATQDATTRNVAVSANVPGRGDAVSTSGILEGSRVQCASPSFGQAGAVRVVLQVPP